MLTFFIIVSIALVVVAAVGWYTAFQASVEIATLEDMLFECREQFLFYEQQHRDKAAKGAVGSTHKAEVNRELAMRITEVLEDY